jgi:hypothetical protein
MSGTAAELVPVREVDDHAVGSGEPGEVTRLLQKSFNDAIYGRSQRYREWLDPIDAAVSETAGTEPSADGRVNGSSPAPSALGAADAATGG